MVLPYIEKALEYNAGEYSPIAVFEALMANRFQLWIGDARNRVIGVMITELVTYPEIVRVRLLFFAADSGFNWKDQWEQVESWAVFQGADGAEALVRPGMEKALSPLGFVPTYRIVTKMFDKRTH